MSDVESTTTRQVLCRLQLQMALEYSLFCANRFRRSRTPDTYSDLAYSLRQLVIDTRTLATLFAAIGKADSYDFIVRFVSELDEAYLKIPMHRIGDLIKHLAACVNDHWDALDPILRAEDAAT